MPQSVAEAYLLILRSTMVPVIGEAIPTPFQGQIELSRWHWELKHDESANEGKGGTASGDADDKGAKVFSGVELIKAVQKMQASSQYPKQEDRDRKVRELIKKATDAQDAADKKSDEAEAGADGNKAGDVGGGGAKLSFTFEKNVDAATTQLLNSMKAGEHMPRAVLTLHHRSTNAPVTLIVTFGNVLLTDYTVSVEPDDTMAELRESWTATYDSVDYVYKNRPDAAGPNGITKGTARVFKMKLKSFF